MPTWFTLGIAIAGLVAGTVALSLSRKMQARYRRRLARLERNQAELLHVVKAMEAHRIEAALERAGVRPALPVTLHATGGEDLWLLELFNPPGQPIQASGFYIECGAFDGKRKSVTWVFDAMGWDGLLVEALPHLAEMARRNRPRATVAQTALAEKGSKGTIRFTHVVGDDPAYEGSSRLSAHAGKDGARGAPMESASEIEVPLTTMAALLEKHAGPIDLLVLDVEGAESRVLDGLDLSKNTPRVMLIEDHTLAVSNDLLKQVEAAGYRHVTWIARNRLLIHEREARLLENAQRLAQGSAARALKG